MHVEPIQEKVEGENFRCHVLSSLKRKARMCRPFEDQIEGVLKYCIKISGAAT